MNMDHSQYCLWFSAQERWCWSHIVAPSLITTLKESSKSTMLVAFAAAGSLLSRRYDLENVLNGISEKVTRENVTYGIYGESKSGAHDLYGNLDTGLGWAPHAP